MIQRLKQIVFIGLCSLTLCLSGCVENDTSKRSSEEFAIDEVRDKGPLTVHVRVDPNTVSIAELLTLQLEATIEPGWAVRMPAIDQVLQHFGIVDWDNLGDRLGDEGRRIKTIQYELEPFLSGEYELPSFTFEFEDVNDPNKTYTLETDPIPVTVTSLLGEDRENLSIADIDTVVAVPRPPLAWWVWTIIIGSIVVIIVVTVLVACRKKKVAALIRIYKPAHEIAYARLQALVEQDLVEKGEIKRFYEEISHILRHYVEDRFQLHAPERTTEEFLQELYEDTSWSGPEKDTLGDFLSHCDLVKFAKYEPTTEEIQQTFDQVKSLIENTRSDQHQVDITDQVQEQEEVTS